MVRQVDSSFGSSNNYHNTHTIQKNVTSKIIMTSIYQHGEEDGHACSRENVNYSRVLLWYPFLEQRYQFSNFISNL